MSDFWFPSLDGLGGLVAGSRRVVFRDLDGSETAWMGVHRPAFERPGSRIVIANGHEGRPEGVYGLSLATGEVSPLTTPAGPVWGANDLSVSDGWVAAGRASERAIMVWPSGAIIDDADSPSIWGPSLVCIKHAWDPGRRHLALNPPARGEADRPYLRLAEGDIRTPRLVEDLIAWCVGTTVWFRWPDGRIEPIGLGRDEFWPVPVYVGRRPYVLTHDDYQHLMLREPGRTHGYLIHRGVTDYPAIARVGDPASDEVHVAWSDRGELGEWRGRLRDLPLVDLTDLRALDPARRFPPRALVDVPDPIDVFSVLCGQERWTRGPAIEGSGTAHVMQGDQSPGLMYATVTKGRHDPEQREVWVLGADGVGLAFDRSNEIEGGYRIVVPGTDRTAAIYPLTMRAGDERRMPIEVLRVRDGHRARYTFLGRCIRVARDEHGDLHGVLSYEFDSEGGWRELFFGHQRAGRWEWRAIRKRTGEVTDVWTGAVERSPVAVVPVPEAYQRPPVAAVDPPVTLTVGRADYPREISPAGFDVLVEDGAGRFRAEWSVRDGQRSVFALTLDGQRATRTVAHPTVIGVAPPGTPPAAGGPAYGPWVLERPSEFTRLREAVEAKWPLGDHATRDEKLAHAIKRRFEGHALAKILDEIAREGEDSPPDVEPPPVDPPPAGGLLHASNFLSEPGHAFFLRFAAFADIVAALQALEVRGYRDAHMLAVEADPYSDFDLYADIPRARRLITAMLEFHLRPWIWLLPETPAVIARYTQDQWIGRMEGLVAGVDDLPVHYCAALESPEYWTDAQLERWVRAIRRVTQRPIAVHGTPGHVFSRAVYAAGAGYHFHQFVSESRGGGFLATETQVRAETQAHAHRLDGWGVRFVAFEYAHRQSHADAARLGDLAVTLGSYGFGNGGTTPPEARYVAPRPPAGGLDAFDLGRVQSWLRGPDIAAWPVTSVLAQATCDGREWRFPHSAAGSWPTFDLGPDTPVEGNVWIVAHVGGRWCAATFDWMRVGQTHKTEPIEHLGVDQVRQAPMDASWVPRKGDELYLFVSTPARDGQKTSRAERSNVMRLTWL